MNTSTGNSAGATIVLVDDDDVDVVGVKRALKKLGIVNPVIRAHDGIEALDILRREEVYSCPYLILLDLNMPRMNGLQFLEALRRDPQLCHSLVFVLTTSSADEDIVAAYKKHVAGYIVKSAAEDEFTRLIKTLGEYWRFIELPVRG